MSIKSIQRYKHLVINVASGSFLLFLGDLSVQILYEDKKQLDQKRLVAAALTGTVLGAEAHVWYRFLDRFIAQTTWTSVFKKVCLDQTIAAPIYTGTYIIGTSLLEGRTTVNELQTDMKRNFVPLYLADCVIYIPTQMINFKYVSPYFRVPFMFAVSFIFNAFLSAFKHRSDDDH